MMRFFTVFIFILLLSANTFSTEHFKDARANDLVNGTSEVWIKSKSEVPHYIKFRDDFDLNEQDVFNWLKDEFSLQPELNFKSLKSSVTEDGIKHEVFELRYMDVPFDFMRLSVHSQKGRVKSISGNILKRVSVLNIASLTPSEAIDIALKAIGSDQYKWEVIEEENWLKTISGDNQSSFYPQPELVVVARDANYTVPDFRYAFKMNVYSQIPASSEDIYIDAQNGDVLLRHDMINDLDSNGIAHTSYSGIRQISTDFYASEFFLRENSRGNGIHTFNMNNGTEFAMSFYFKDEDNNWLYPQNDLDAFATDAHWGAEVTYDYLDATFNRNSIDNDGFRLNSYVHYGEGYTKSHWDKELKVMVYGDGPGSLLPPTTLDIVGHEIGHGLTQFTADFIYKDESGALSESFSDILGNCVEYFGKPGTFSWQIGEDMGSYVRDMSFPNAKGHPDTYKGDNWYVGTKDNGGVHTNSGVQNFWFYLLTEGGNGINDIGYSYNVDGIGIVNAALIAHRALTVYLSPTSDYEEACFYTTLAAIDLFGNCSSQHEATVKAWNAVGIENEYVSKTVASFSAQAVDYCNVPFTVDFSNSSVNGVSYNWSIIDDNSTVGFTSTDKDMRYTFDKVGEYDVSLKVDGNGCGLAEIVKENLINVTQINTPSGSGATIFKGDSIMLSATSSVGQTYWYSDAEGNNVIAQGNAYQSPKLENSVNYYVKTIVDGQIHDVGLNLYNASSGGQYSTLDAGMKFNVYQNLQLNSIMVKSKLAASRQFYILDENGNKVFEKAFSLESGEQEVQLNVSLPAGDNYELHVDGDMRDLWSNQDARYPYEETGLISLTGNTLEIDNLYAYFYGWKVQEEPCESELSTLAVSVLDINEVNKPAYKFYVNGSGDFIYFIDFFFKEDSKVQFDLFGINGQHINSMDRLIKRGGEESDSHINVNELFGLNTLPSGVYFLTVNGGGVEKTEKIVNKGGSN